jgi:CheY-like chemotaxis protein
MATNPQDKASGNPQVNEGSPAIRAYGKHVLYVDDDEALVYLFTCILERLSYQVTGCTDPIEALNVFRSAPTTFHAVVSDLLMPGISGIEFAQELRRIRPDIPILMTSGEVRPQDAALVRSLGLPELVLKPYAVDELGRLVADMLKRERSRRTHFPPNAEKKAVPQS